MRLTEIEELRLKKLIEAHKKETKARDFHLAEAGKYSRRADKFMVELQRFWSGVRMREYGKV